MTLRLEARQNPAIAAINHICAGLEQIRAFAPMRYTVPDTDAFGRSDTRTNLRRHFEVDRFHVTQAAGISALATCFGNIPCHPSGRAI